MSQLLQLLVFQHKTLNLFCLVIIIHNYHRRHASYTILMPMSMIWHLKNCFPTPVCLVGWQGWQHIREEREIPQKGDIKAPPWEALFSAPSSDWNVRNFKRQTRSRSLQTLLLSQANTPHSAAGCIWWFNPQCTGKTRWVEFVPSTNALKIQLPTAMLM